MKKRIIKHLIYIISSFIFLWIIEKYFFNAPCGAESLGIVVLALFTSLILFPILYKMRLMLKLVLIVVLYFIPFQVVRLISEILYNLYPDRYYPITYTFISFFAFYFVSILFIELGVLMDKKMMMHNTSNEGSNN